MAVFYLNHAGLGKAVYDREGAIAHGRYILRKKALAFSESRNMPKSYKAVLNFLGRLYDESRKNARVYDKLILNLPREMSRQQHIKLLRAFLDTVTFCRTPYLFAIHSDKPENPHAHVIIRDADIETGRRVAGLSKAGSSYRLRFLWEKICNTELMAAGHAVQISRRGRAWQVQQRHEEIQRRAALLPSHVTTSTVLTSAMPIEPQTASIVPVMANVITTKPERDFEPLAPEDRQVFVETEMPSAQDDAIEAPQEQDMASLAQDNVDGVLASATALLHSLAQLREIEGRHLLVKTDRQALADVDAELKRLGELSQQAINALSNASMSAMRAQMDFKHYRSIFGGLKGYSLLGFKSRKRLLAESALKSLHVAFEHQKIAKEQVNRLSVQTEASRSRRDRICFRLKDIEQTYGTEQDFEQAKTIHKTSIDIEANGLRNQAPVIDKLLAQKRITPEAHAKLMDQIRKAKQAERSASAEEEQDGGVGY